MLIMIRISNDVSIAHVSHLNMFKTISFTFSQFISYKAHDIDCNSNDDYGTKKNYISRMIL